MIIYNIVYVFVLRRRAKKLVTDADKFEKIIDEQIEIIKKGENVSEEHKGFLCKKLDKTGGLSAFDKALESVSEKDSESVIKYLTEIFSVFEYLTHRYVNKDTLEIAYFPHILYKYDILKFNESESILNALFGLLRSANIYCRENTLKALYSMQKADVTADALKIIDKNLSFHHPKLICDGLLICRENTDVLKDKLFENFGEFSVQMRVNILNYFRFGNVRCDEEMLSILGNEDEDRELRFSAIRYFEKYPSGAAEPIVRNLAENTEGRTWEFQAIATSALKSYPGDATFRILTKNLSSSNWHVRQNSAISCEKLGYTYHDLINVFDGNDRYAREIMRYRLDRRSAEEEAVKS